MKENRRKTVLHDRILRIGSVFALSFVGILLTVSCGIPTETQPTNLGSPSHSQTDFRPADLSSTEASAPLQTSSAASTDPTSETASKAADGAEVSTSENTSPADTALSANAVEEAASSAGASSAGISSDEDYSALKAKIDLENAKPNELGEVLIVLYHHIGGEDSLYYRSVKSFRADLKALYDRGYRAVSIEDYIRSTYDIPAGTTPVVLTFDDGTVSHFKVALDAEGNPYPDPNCAVGVMDAFCAEYPDFGRHAVFFINAGAFGEPAYLEWKLKYLHENGYEIGNHTLTHAALDALDPAGIQREIGKNADFYRTLYPDLSMISLAYPYGNRAKPEHRHLLLSGKYEGKEYKNEIGIIAGWCPTKPLYAESMSPLEVHRVQGGVNSQQLDWWLDLLDREPHRRFYSDGVGEIITIPEELRSEVDEGRVDARRLYFYGDANR